MFKNILVPVDGSEISKKAANKAIELAQGLNATVTVTNIMDQKLAVPYEQQEANAHEIVNEIVEIGLDKNVDMKSMIIFGSPKYDIIKIALKSEADLIVMGTHGKTGLKAQILGSFAQATLKNVNLPIMLIK